MTRSLGVQRVQRGENAAINDKRHIVGCTLREPNLPVRFHWPLFEAYARSRFSLLYEYACVFVCVYVSTSLSLSLGSATPKNGRTRSYTTGSRGYYRGALRKQRCTSANASLRSATERCPALLRRGSLPRFHQLQLQPQQLSVDSAAVYRSVPRPP